MGLPKALQSAKVSTQPQTIPLTISYILFHFQSSSRSLFEVWMCMELGRKPVPASWPSFQLAALTLCCFHHTQRLSSGSNTAIFYVRRRSHFQSLHWATIGKLYASSSISRINLKRSSKKRRYYCLVVAVVKWTKEKLKGKLSSWPISTQKVFNEKPRKHSKAHMRSPWSFPSRIDESTHKPTHKLPLVRLSFNRFGAFWPPITILDDDRIFLWLWEPSMHEKRSKSFSVDMFLQITFEE